VELANKPRVTSATNEYLSLKEQIRYGLKETFFFYYLPVKLFTGLFTSYFYMYRAIFFGTRTRDMGLVRVIYHIFRTDHAFINTFSGGR